MMRKLSWLIILLAIALGGCNNSMEIDGKKVIKDLAFHKADSEKSYADLVLKAVLTNRDKVVFDQLSDPTIDARALNVMVSAYSQSIGSKDWEFVDVLKENPSTNIENGIDYNWLDKRGRTAVQIHITPTKKNDRFTLSKIEFRSRLDILESEAFPGGPISDYKKIASKG